MKIPDEPVSLERVFELWPTLRQSLLSTFDDCALSAYFSLRYGQGWSTTPQARGTIFHRAVAEMLRTMQRQGHETIPPSEAEQILVEVCRQRDVPPQDIVRVPLRQMPELRMAVRKLAKDNAFSIRKIVDIEKRLEAPVTYTAGDGSAVRRRLTGQLDLLLFDPPDGAVVVDFKDTWGLPPEPRDTEPRGFDDEELKGLSYHGYFQQRWYSALVLWNYRNVNRVTLREYYPRFTKVRKATVHRHQLPEIEEELSILAQAFDQAVAQGSPMRLLRGDAEGFVDIDGLGWWKPQPGKHCSFCVRAASCPIEEEAREAVGGAATSVERARRLAARLQVLDKLRSQTIDACKGWVEMGGAPIPVKWAKGRRALGWYETRRGRRFGFFTPDASDRGGHADVDVQLADAMREATARAKAERGVKPRRRGVQRRAGKA